MSCKKLLSFLLLSLICLPLCSQSSDSLSLAVTPGASLPLGESVDLFELGGSLGLSGDYPLPFLPGLSARGRLGFGLSPTPADTNLTTVSLAAGPVLNFPLLPKLSAGIEILGGASIGLYEGESSLGPFFSLGGGLAYQLSPALSLGLGTAYQHHFASSLTLYQGLSLHLGTSFQLGGGQAARLEIREITIDPIFPVFYKYYDDHPMGKARIENLENGPVEEVTVSLLVDQYMDRPKICAVVPRLKRGEKAEVELFALFNDQVLTITEGTKAAAELQVSYQYLDTARQKKSVQTVRLYDRNAVTWEDDRRAAAFVTAKDPEILQLSKKVAGIIRSEGNWAINPTFRIALGIFQSLRLAGVNYVIDPQTPYAEFSQDKVALDYLQFPRQTLGYYAGDCDDLSILYCALLESVGIETAFITVPGHIYMAFDIGEPPEEAAKMFHRSDDLIVYGDKAWLPVEITQVQEGFVTAWRTGAKEWREHQEGKAARLYPMHDSWQLYEPVAVPEGGSDFTFPSTEKIRAAYSDELERFIDREIREQEAVLLAEIRKSGGESRLRNRLGLLYARYGLFAKAEAEFQKILSRGEYVPALVNLGNIYYLKKDYKTALGYFQRARRQQPDNPLVVLSLARLSFEDENYSAAREAHGELASLAPELAKRFSYLSGGEDTAQRADAQLIKEVPVWSE